MAGRLALMRLARHLNGKPVATVIYDPWLGWELGYYLGVWHDKRRVHYPDADVHWQLARCRWMRLATAISCSADRSAA